MTDWSPEQYLKFNDERTRAARDLLARVPPGSRKLIYDLGCGPGNSTALLVDAFPDSEVIGVDNSPAMLEQARASVCGAMFEHADLNGWLPQRSADLIFSNATFQWLPQHLSIMCKLAQTLPPGGVLAVQMPDNLGEPSHALMREVAALPEFADVIGSAATVRASIASPLECYSMLNPIFGRVDIWHTIYNHPLDGVTGIVEWLSSTGLRPFLAPLHENQRRCFLEKYQKLLLNAYPKAPDGKVLLRFPRLFLVAQK